MKYPYLRAWGYYLGLSKDYIDRQVRRATYDKAPHTAIYKTVGGEWKTVNDLKNDNTKNMIKRKSKKFISKKPRS